MVKRSSSARINYFDRNSLISNLTYQAAAIAPHAVTTRATYTLPANRNAIITSVSLQLIRDVVATTAALAKIGVLLNALSIQEATVLGTGVTGALNDHDSTHTGISSDIHVAAQTIIIQTSDASTGGSYTYRGYVEITEYDT